MKQLKILTSSYPGANKALLRGIYKLENESHCIQDIVISNYDIVCTITIVFTDQSGKVVTCMSRYLPNSVYHGSSVLSSLIGNRTHTTCVCAIIR